MTDWALGVSRGRGNGIVGDCEAPARKNVCWEQHFERSDKRIERGKLERVGRINLANCKNGRDSHHWDGFECQGARLFRNFPAEAPLQTVYRLT